MSEVKYQQLNLLEPIDDVQLQQAAQLVTSESVSVEPIQNQAARPKKVAFGGYVKPEMYDVFGDYDLTSVTQDELDWMKPTNLGGFLFEPDKAAPFVVDGLGLNPTEYGIVVRWPGRLAEMAAGQSLKEKDLDETVMATAARARIHVLEAKMESMTQHESKLKEQRTLLRELAKHAKSPGYAHITEERMKELTSAAWLEFKNILDVVHVQRDWTEDQRKRAEATLIHYLTQGSQRVRIAHWQAMIGLADGYVGARKNFFASRRRQTSTMLDKESAEYGLRFE